MKTEDNRIYSH